MKYLISTSSSFKKALILSIFLHIIIFALIGFSNYLTPPAKKGMVHYVNLNFVGLPGGGGRGGGGGSGGQPGTLTGEGKTAAPVAETKKETMKELTVPQKASPTPTTSLRHPVEKETKTKEKTPPKKTAISAPQPGASKEEPAAGETTGAGGGAGSGSGGGTGLRIGVGEGEGDFGGGLGGELGTASFPYTYYLQTIIDRVSSNWFTGISSLNFTGEYQSVIYFKILRNGQIADLKIEKSSGLPALDLTARRAVEMAAPFPPLPSDFESEYLVIHLIFERSQ